MSHRNNILTVTVAQSGIVSDTIPLMGVVSIGMSFPVLSPSCQAFFQVAQATGDGTTTPTSASFVRVRSADFGTASLWNAQVGVGSIAAVIDREVYPWTHGRIELSVAQNSSQAITIAQKRGVM